MDGVSSAAGSKRDRSPSFPFIDLEIALQRVAAFDTYFGRHPVPSLKVGLAWGMKGGKTSQALQTVAALRAYGFLRTQITKEGGYLSLSDEARTFLRAQQGDLKKQIIRRAALRPKQIELRWGTWGADRPPDPVCLDELVLRDGFSQDGAEKFLKVYDATIAFAGLAESDKIGAADGPEALDVLSDNEEVEQDDSPRVSRSAPMAALAPHAEAKERLMEGERELTTGLLSKDSSFRLIVTGPVGVKEIERLIRKLEFDKEILADEEDRDAASE